MFNIKDLQIGHVCKLKNGSEAVIENITKDLIVLRNKKGQLIGATHTGIHLDPSVVIKFISNEGQVILKPHKHDLVGVVKNTNGSYKRWNY